MPATIRDRIAEQLAYHWWRQKPAGAGGACACGHQDDVSDGYTYHVADIILMVLIAAHHPVLDGDEIGFDLLPQRFGLRHPRSVGNNPDKLG